ncbi:hypothetical protein ACFL1X_05195 [Candidatus Hydrogenedentota bacterium]
MSKFLIKSAVCVVLAAFIVANSACTTYLGYPYSTRSALDQRMVSKSVDDALDAVTYPGSLSGTRVYVDVASVFTSDSPADYVRASIVESITSTHGAAYVSERSDAEVVLLVKVKAAGTDRRGGFSPLAILAGIFYTQLIKTSTAELEGVVIDSEGVFVESFSTMAENRVRYMWFLLGIIGPFTADTLGD